MANTLAPPMPLDRALRPGGYSTAQPQGLLELLLAGATRGNDISQLPTLAGASPTTRPPSPGAVQEYSAPMEAGQPPIDPSGKVGAINPHEGGGALGNLFGWNGNPIYEGVKAVGASGFFDDLAYGLSTGTNLSEAFGNATQHALAMRGERRQQAEASQSKRQLLDVLGKYGDGYDDIADALRSGAVDAKTAWNAMFSRHADLAEQGKIDARNKGNAGFLTDPTLRAAVESGAMSFRDAYDIEHGKKQGLINAGDGTIFDPNTREWITNPNAGAAAPDIKEIFGFEKDLWAQYANSDPVKTYEAVKGGYERVRESAAQQSGAGDMALLYGYMRMLDPGSVVRESEFATAAQAGSFGEQVQGMVTKLLNGQRLPESQRQEFLANAEKLYAASADNLQSINNQFSQRAGGYGVDPERFIRQPETFPAYGQPTAISTQQEYEALPSGTQYIAPDGTVRTKP